MTNRAALLRFSGLLLFFGYASPACTDDESVAENATGGSANRSGGGYVSDAGALSSAGGELSQGGAAGANTGVPEGGAAGSPYPPEPGGAAGMPFGDGGTTGAGQSSTQAGDSGTGGRKPEGHSPQGGAPAGECGEFRGASGAIGAGGANGQLAPALEGTYCECDGPWNACYIDPEQFCYGPPELGCNPTLEKMLAVLSDSCARGTYSECPDHQVLVQLEYHSPTALEFQFDDRTGTLTYAEAFPVEPDCNVHGAQAYYLIRSAVERADTADCRNCSFGYGDVEGACSFGEEGGAAGESQGGQAGAD